MDTDTIEVKKQIEEIHSGPKVLPVPKDRSDEHSSEGLVNFNELLKKEVEGLRVRSPTLS